MTIALYGRENCEEGDADDEAYNRYGSTSLPDVHDEPPSKRLKLLANYQARSSTQHRTGTPQQLTKYLDMELSEGDDDYLSFWHRNSVGLNKLYPPALRALSVLASCSSAVERVFSQRGLILRPQRARMGDKLLSRLNATVGKVSKCAETVRLSLI